MNNLPNKNNTVCIIPFYNEFRTINIIANQVLQYVDNLILIDDGSNDNYNLDVSKNYILIKHKKNIGKGAALISGFKKSLEMNYDFIITLDADLQHPPDCIPNFLKALNFSEIVIGKRNFQNSTMPIQRRLSNYLSSYLLSLKTKIKIHDSQSGYRAFRTDSLRKIIPKCNGFEAETEMIIRAAKAKFTISFINIPTVYNNNVSKMNSVQTTLNFLKLLTKRF